MLLGPNFKYDILSNNISKIKRDGLIFILLLLLLLFLFVLSKDDSNLFSSSLLDNLKFIL